VAAADVRAAVVVVEDGTRLCYGSYG
jgi:hypothetical protein